ncbi:MAG: geranylgeranylglyceryl/heptaprenylglyceryl phosphate synthase [Candidatus Thermoplasmatota archaeon]
MKLLNKIMQHLAEERMHMTLLDPEKQGSDDTGEMALRAARSGTDAIMIGGSTGVTQERLDRAIAAIRARVELPVILFPRGAGALSSKADGVYFMSLLNSRSRRFLIGEQVRGAPVVRALGIEPLPLGYIVVEPGMKVGDVGMADPLRRNDLDAAVAYALCAQYLGMRFVYLEAGSGAPEPVPAEMVSAVKEAIEVPLIVGGGVRMPEQARKLAHAGADILVTGTLVETGSSAELKRVIRAFKSA